MATAKERKTGSKISKAELITTIAEAVGDGISRTQVKAVLDSVATIGRQELKKTGSFIVPGFSKFVVLKRPARAARKGINPFTKEPTTFAAKPASRVVRARLVKALKDAVKG